MQGPWAPPLGEKEPPTYVEQKTNQIMDAVGQRLSKGGEVLDLLSRRENLDLADALIALENDVKNVIESIVNDLY